MDSEATHPLAPQGVFWTVQGEGALLGVPQVFVRLAGCNVNCPDCDTDYRVAERVPVADIVRRVVRAADGAGWVWVTGGEPTVHDLGPLVRELRRWGFRVALATAGVNPVPRGWKKVATGEESPVAPWAPDFVSVSPHWLDARWVQRRGEQCNVVPGLNGLKLDDVDPAAFAGFEHKFVTPMWYGGTDRMDNVRECVEWVRRHPGWRLGIQGHKFWSLQ